MSPVATRHVEPDEACAAAIELARAAAEEDAGPDQVGAHVGVEAEADRVVTHLFASLNQAYVGWRWAVTVSRAARSKVVTVSESMLLPGPDSLLAPPWVPWTERVRPGDLKAGDLMPASSDDERLVPFAAIEGEAGLLDWDESDTWRFGGEPHPTAAGSGDAPATAAAGVAEAVGPARAGGSAGADSADGPAEPAEADSADGPAEPAEADSADGPDGTVAAAGPDGTVELAGAGSTAEPAGADGTGDPARTDRAAGAGSTVLRPRRVLSAIGRDEAAVRWYSGEHGPSSPLASSAPATCLTCGFMIRLSGRLGRVFGVCANEFAPDDGKVVSVDHGCGAHSDGDVMAAEAAVGGATLPTVDELGYDMVNAGSTLPDSVLETLDHELA